MLVYQRKGDTLVKLNLGDGISYEQIVSLENAVKAAASAAQAAKESADSKLPLAGGTMTGNLAFQTPVNESDIPSNNYYFNLLSALSKNNNPIFRIYGWQWNDDHYQLSIALRHHDSDNEVDSYSILGFLVYPDATKNHLTCPTISSNAPTTAVINKAAADRDYLRLDGTSPMFMAAALNTRAPEWTGSNGLYRFDFNINVSPGDDNYSFSNMVAMSGQRLAATHPDYDTWVDETAIRSLLLLGRNPTTNALLPGVGVCEDKLGNWYGTSPNPRENHYRNDVDTLQASINRHPVRLDALTPTRNLYLGGANASDTANLWQGRGTSPEMPFASLLAVFEYASRLDDPLNVLTIRIQTDINVPASLTAYLNNFRYVNLTGVVNNGVRPKLIGNAANNLCSVLTLGSGKIDAHNLVFENLALATVDGANITFTHNVDFNINASAQSLLYASGAGAKILLYPDSVCTFSGICHTVMWAQNGAFCFAYPTAQLSGSIAGRRYNVINNSTLYVGGSGANKIPGTTAGTCDANSKYF